MPATAPFQLLIVLLVAFNLRGALIALTPVMDQIRADTGLSSSAAGLLVTLPVLCFAVFSPAAPALARRLGIERSLGLAMAVLVAGVLLRLPAEVFPLFAGSIALGAAIAVGNVLLPALVKRDFPARIGAVTGAYVTVMSAGATIAAGATILVEDATGLDWRAVLALWALPATAAVLLCLRPPVRHDVRERTRPAMARHLFRDAVAWQVTLFMGFQSLVFYASVAWLPTLFVASGLSEGEAGLLNGVMNLLGLPASLVAPVLAARRPSQTPLILVTCLLAGAGLLGVVLAPLAAPVLWMVMLGLGQGAAIGMALTLIGLRTRDSAQAAHLSGMAQGIGYALAALGPLAVGALQELTGSWRQAFVLTLVALALQTLTGLGAARARVVGGAQAA